MDIVTLRGVISAFGLFVAASMTRGGRALFINIPSALFAIGGTT